MSKEKKDWEEIGRAVYEEWANRPAFTYTPTRDPAYTAARDAALRDARLAARDAEARAAARTGGYGSSYASMAANDAYEGGMRALDGVVEGLYELAYGRYKDEGDTLLTHLKIANENAAREAAAEQEAAARAEAAEKEAAERAEKEAADKARAEEAEKKRNDALRASPLWPMGYNPADVTVPEEWHGTNDREAVAVMLKAGVAEHVVEAMRPRAEWVRQKLTYDRNGTPLPSEYAYKTYEDYMIAYVNTALGMIG